MSDVKEEDENCDDGKNEEAKRKIGSGVMLMRKMKRKRYLKMKYK